MSRVNSYKLTLEKSVIIDRLQLKEDSCNLYFFVEN